MKLGLHIIPSSSFGANLRNQMSAREWSKLSRKVRGENNFTCQQCGSQEDRSRRWYTHLHEIWEFDDKKHIQKLVGFECLCPDCHHIRHWMFSEYKQLDLDYLIDHACRVNKCMSWEFEQHILEEKKLWEERSLVEWTLDLGEWSDLV